MVRDRGLLPFGCRVKLDGAGAANQGGARVTNSKGEPTQALNTRAVEGGLWDVLMAADQREESAAKRQRSEDA